MAVLWQGSLCKVQPIQLVEHSALSEYLSLKLMRRRNIALERELLGELHVHLTLAVVHETRA